MKLRYFLAAMLLCGASAVANAQSIGEQELAQIKGSFVKDAHTTAVQNILLGDANIKNKTNFDFSGYFGYWGIERAIPALYTEYYAPYHLTAFGMLGSTSSYLPLAQLARDNKGKPLTDDSGSQYYLYGSWELDSKGCPISFVDGSGRKTEIRYVE